MEFHGAASHLSRVLPSAFVDVLYLRRRRLQRGEQWDETERDERSA